MSDHAGTIVVLAKEPVAGRVKTRLQPAFSANEAARLAAAAITDTCAAVRDSAASRRILSWEGDPPDWANDWDVVPQPSGTLNDRLLFALNSALTEPTAAPALLIGMDTPQVTGALLDTDWGGADAVLGLSDDGGFWAIGLRHGFPPRVFEGVPMSTPRTGAAQLARLLDHKLAVRLLPPLRDVDDAEDADEIAYRFPALAFSRCYADLLAARPHQPADRVFDRAYASGQVTTTSLTWGRRPLPMDVRRWRGAADPVDEMVVSRCEPPVVDLGCGPGRLVRALNRSGRPALGIDMSAVAVAESLRRDAPALRRRIAEPLPGEGRWGTAVLLDTNIGIGGDVPALLRRCRELVGAGGLIICEVDPEPDRDEVHRIVLSSGEVTSTPLPWAQVGARAVRRAADRLNLFVVEEWSGGGRVFLALRTAG